MKWENLDECFHKSLEMLKQLSCEYSFQRGNLQKFIKISCLARENWKETFVLKLHAFCSAILHKKMPHKCRDLESFIISCKIKIARFDKSLCNSDASINLMPLSIYNKIKGKLRVVKLISVSLQLEDQSTIIPKGIIQIWIMWTLNFWHI